MIFKTSEAKNMACPMKMGKGFGACVGKDCAAWRWWNDDNRLFKVSTPNDLEQEPKRPDHIPASWTWVPYGDDHSGWLEPEEEMKTRRTGFCGLAGLPGTPA